MSQAAATRPAPESEDGRPSYPGDQVKVQEQSYGRHDRDAEVGDILVMLRAMIRDVVAESVGNLKQTIMQTECKLTVHLRRVEALVAKDFVMRQSKQKPTPPLLPQNESSPRRAQQHQPQSQLQGVEEVDTSRLQPPLPAPVHPAPVQAASPAPAPARQAPPAVTQQAPVPPTVPVARHGAPQVAGVAPASTKQITAASGQAKPPPSGVGSATASSTSRNATRAGHANAGSGSSSGGASSRSGTAHSFKTVEEAEAYFQDQQFKELRESLRRRPTPPARSAAQDSTDSTQSITSKPPVTLPGMTGNQVLDEFAHVLPPQQASPATSGRNDLRTSPKSHHTAVFAERASSSSPQQRTGFSFSRLFGT